MVTNTHGDRETTWPCAFTRGRAGEPEFPGAHGSHFVYSRPCSLVKVSLGGFLAFCDVLRGAGDPMFT